MAEAHPIQTRKVSVEDAKRLDRAKMGVAIAKQPEGEVEVHSWYWRKGVCPWHSCEVWIYYDTDEYHWYTCGYCGNAFKI